MTFLFKLNKTSQVKCNVNNRVYYAPIRTRKNQRLWNTNELENVIKLHLVENKGVVNISKVTGIGVKSLLTLLRLNKAKISKFSSLSHEQIEESIKERYLKGEASLKIAKSLKIRGQRVIDTVKKLGLKRNDINEKYWKEETANSIKRYCYTYYGSLHDYTFIARRLTIPVYRLYKDFIDPTNLKDKGYSIDHIISVNDGYKHRIPIALIAHPCNLRMISVSENAAKNSRSLLTKLELHKLIDEFEEVVGPNLMGEIYAKSPEYGFYIHRVEEETYTPSF